QVAAIAYILRHADWAELVEEAARSSERAVSSARIDEAAREVSRLNEQLEAVRRLARTEQDQLRGQLDQARAEAEDLRRRLRTSADRVRRAEAAARETSLAAQTERDAALQAARESDAEARRLRARISDLEAAASATRRDNRESRSQDDARMRVLLDTLMAAANGVRRELSLPTTVARPADLLSRAENGRGFDPFSAVGARGRSDDDPSLIDDVLVIPGLHLIIDGYNVTKRGYGSLTLQAQRARLLAGVGALAGRSLDTEVTVVFDATAVLARPVGVAMPRGVRVVFSQAGELADDEIQRLVRAEPQGRPVAVVTSDREVADNCAALGARTVSSDALLARLDR
ncbi:NYN domain-containing protein, partial [Frankia sp. EI5c]|uniref:NYN domain-containing protein n=1 Tax=Frankia sp. EI5c TaxID=683316 RepID=UPI001F5BF748